MNLWQREFKESLRTTKDLNLFFDQEFPRTPYKSFIPISFAHKIKAAGVDSPLWKQFLPSKEENCTEGLYDPIGDQKHLKTPQLIHRYKNRALFLPTTICPITCRYCFRKNELNENDQIFKAEFKKVLDYLKEHPEIEEVIFSGGDPLILTDDKLSTYLDAFYEIGIKYIRFHTRTPIILPSRIDESFQELINKFSNKFEHLSLVIHVNHLEELSLDTQKSLNILKNMPILLLSQSVLLKGVNDCEKKLSKLFQRLSFFQVRPYYLHHPDLVKGGLHFYLSLPQGREIYRKLRDILPGWMIPHYILDVPGGHGKTTAYNPESLKFSGHLLDKQGNTLNFSDTEALFGIEN